MIVLLLSETENGEEKGLVESGCGLKAKLELALDEVLNGVSIDNEGEEEVIDVAADVDVEVRVGKGVGVGVGMNGLMTVP